METLKVFTLGNTEQIYKNFLRYMQAHSEDKEVTKEDVINYIEEHADTDTEEPAVYVGTYRKYNCGNLFGMWVNLATFSDYSDFLEYCEALHSDEESPEFMFQDYQNFPSSWYCESSLRERFDDILKFNDLDDEKKDACEAYIDSGEDGDIDDIEDQYEGEWDSEVEYAEYIAEEFFPEFFKDNTLSPYFDYEAFARDIFNTDYLFLENKYVFRRYY